MSTQPNEVVPTWTTGDRLGKALAHAGITVAAMADYLGVSRNTVGNYINDRTRVPRPTMMLWAMRTGVPLSWIEGDDGPTGPTPPNNGPRKPDPDALAELAAKKRRRARGGSTREYVHVASAA